ncbi:hypothetical protein EVG20_g7025 [Dentipellis fragilis]|uniref:Uncharacterized protein n=1 Tax=Dentipellis fragilis TaxID=205917 RepID=A0A4Y9YG40_9AGAM|nr:hypothetical protein EVG20_g7025 [Dentipellis fragilis]
MAPSSYDFAADQEQFRYEMYLSAMQYYNLISERTLPPVPQWPQIEQPHDFHLQPHCSVSTELDLLQDAMVEGSYCIAMPLSDVVDTYPALPGPTAYQQALLSPMFAPGAMKMEDIQAQAMVPLYEDHVQQPVPVQSPQPVYLSRIAPAAFPDNRGGSGSMNRMRIPTPLFTYDELDTWAALERGSSHSLSCEYSALIKLEPEDTMDTSPDTASLTAGHVEPEDPRADSSAFWKGVADPLFAESAKGCSIPPVAQVFPDAEEAPGKTPKAPTSPSLSPPRANYSGIKKKEKPTKPPPFLACFFCRGRKIACTPLDPGSSDKTCE